MQIGRGRNVGGMGVVRNRSFFIWVTCTFSTCSILIRCLQLPFDDGYFKMHSQVGHKTSQFMRGKVSLKTD